VKDDSLKHICITPQKCPVRICIIVLTRLFGVHVAFFWKQCVLGSALCLKVYHLYAPFDHFQSGGLDKVLCFKFDLFSNKKKSSCLRRFSTLIKNLKRKSIFFVKHVNFTLLLSRGQGLLFPCRGYYIFFQKFVMLKELSS